ncbi:MFS general substrate transporter [Schizophyllum commune Tattone D]|nr:MFS general substrate transporter [Schizophyllum commune Tattone D]
MASEAEKYSWDSSSYMARAAPPRGLRGMYSRPVVQVVMLGFVCFMCPGLFNALNGLGAGGQLDARTSASANAALYLAFAVSAFFAGTVNNTIGPRYTLFLGTIGYSLYIGAYLAMNIHQDASKFVIAAGAVLGICAGMLWTAQGSLMLSYPQEHQKGRFIGIFWAIFNLGGIVGAAVSLGANYNSRAGAVNNSTYITFLVLTSIGVLIPLLMVDPRSMVRSDGSRLANPRHPSWKNEFYGLYITVKTDPMILMLFPMFFVSNWFYTWQFNDYNAAIFNIRARSLNNLVYWVAQVIGSVSIGILLDQHRLPRRLRAFAGWSILFCMIFVVHIWAYFYQRTYTREVRPSYDIYDSKYVGYILCYVFMGIFDAMWQTTTYWLIGAMSNDAAKLAHFAGFYKSLQSAGAAAGWYADYKRVPYMHLFLSEWCLLVAGLVFALPMVHLRVKDHTTLQDETLARMDDSGRIASVDETYSLRDAS